MPGLQTIDESWTSDTLRLGFDLVVRADFGTGTHPPSDHVPAVEAAVHGIVSRLLCDGNRALHGLANLHAADRRQLRMLVPGPQSSILLEPLDAWLRQSLEGDKTSQEIGSWRFEGSLPPIRLICDEIAFQDGSLTSRMKGVLTGGTFLATLAMTPYAVDAYGNSKVTEQLSARYGEQTCVTDTQITLKAGDLYRVAAPQFNYRILGLSPDEKRARVCYAQLAMNLADIDAGPIDGLLGPRTSLGLEAFRERYKLHTADVSDDSVQIALTKALQNGLNQMKK